MNQRFCIRAYSRHSRAILSLNTVVPLQLSKVLPKSEVRMCDLFRISSFFRYWVFRHSIQGVASVSATAQLSRLRFVQLQFLDHCFPDFELLDLAGDGLRKTVHEAHVAGNFEMRQLAATEFAHLVLGHGLVRF
jgi:hypothetical protein